MVAKLYPQTDLTLWVSSKAQNSTFSEYGHVAYQIKVNHECSNMVANILPADPHFLTLEMRSKFNLFSEHGHVACQIKGNLKCSDMEANILAAAPPSFPGPGGLKGHNSTFSEHVYVA